VTLEELDAELRAVRASLRRLRDDTLAEFTEMLETETNPYTREMLIAQIEWVRNRDIESDAA
jgi:hypothetical protein